MGNRTQAVWVAIAMLLFAAAGIGGGMYLQRTSLAAVPQPETAPAMDKDRPDTAEIAGDGAASVVGDVVDALGAATAEDDAGLPRIDVVRIDPDGGALVAGSAPAGGQVTLRLDGTEVATSETDAEGNFVSFFDLQATDKPGLLTLESADADGLVQRASDSIIVAPPADKIATAETPAQTEQVASVDPSTALPGSGGATGASGAPAIPDAAAPGTPPATGDGPAAIPQTATATPGTAQPETSAPATADADLASEPAAAQDGVEMAALSTPPPAEPAAPRLFRAGPDGVTVLNDPNQPPAVAERLGIDAIAYDETGEVQLTGRAAGDSELRIYLDNRAIRTVRVGEGGSWASPLPDVETGVYTLRIDALDDDGTVASRIETPFERTAPELAAAARESGVTAITVQPGFTLWAISQGYFGDGVDYVQIFEANRDIIRDPNLIYPGQVFTLPEATNTSETALAEGEPQQ